MPFPAIAAILGRLGAGGVSGGIEAAMSGLGKGGGKPPPIPGTNNRKIFEAAQGVKEVGEAAAQVPAAMQSASAGINKVSQTFAGFVTNLSAPIQAVQTMGQALGQFTALSNPGQFAVFQRTMADAFAALGKGLEPLMSFMIRLGQFVGDTFAKFSPVLAAVSGGLAAAGDMMLKIFGDVLVTTLTALTPVFDVIISLFKDFYPVFVALQPVFLLVVGTVKLLANALQVVLWPFNQVIKVLQALGIVGKSFNPNASSKGAAAQQFSVSTSADEVQRQMATAALSSSGEMEEDPAKKVPGILEQIYAFLAKFSGDIPKMLKDAFMEFVDAVIQGIKDAAKAPFQSGYDAAEGLLNTVRGLGIT